MHALEDSRRGVGTFGSQQKVEAPPIHRTIVNGGAPGRVTASAGAAGFLPRDTADKLIERATAGLKVAKTEGRNRIVEMQPDGPVWTAARIT